MKISYIKTQWLNLVAAVIYLGISIYNFCAGETLWGVAWTMTAMTWFIMSLISYNADMIELLEKKAEKYDAMYDLVQELLEANKVDRESMDMLDAKIRHVAKYTDFSGGPRND